MIIIGFSSELEKTHERLGQPPTHSPGKDPVMLLLSRASTDSCGKAFPDLPHSAGRSPEKLLFFKEKTWQQTGHVILVPFQAANSHAGFA